MIVRLVTGLAMLLSATAAAGAEAIATARVLFADVWKRAECNQGIDQALNNARYHELGGGYSLGMVLCWLGSYQQSEIMFMVAPKTSGRPQLLAFQEWRDGKFVPADVLVMAEFDSDTKALSSLTKFRGPGDCGSLGHWAWGGTDFRMTGYWYKGECDGDLFEPDDRYRVFPPRK